jgi:sensor histidine kinase regulating citrate/malate metabolism
MLVLPLQTNASQLQSTIGFVVAGGILVANIVNYFLLQNIVKVQELYQVEEYLEKQIEYQTGKYQQLSTAYRDTRRLIHDTKKHYFFIQSCMDERNYDAVVPYLKQSIKDMENTFLQINTGNLVVDSFLSNYISIAQKQGIQFRTNLQINPNDISIRDYDLSIILGNLLDNAISACNTIEPTAPRQISVEMYTTTYEFIIHIENTFRAQRYSKTDMEQLNHGYGTKNVEMITLSYDGNYTHYEKNENYHAIVSIPFLESDLLSNTP